MADSLVWQVRERGTEREREGEKGGGQSRSDTAVIRGQSSIANSITDDIFANMGTHGPEAE